VYFFSILFYEGVLEMRIPLFVLAFGLLAFGQQIDPDYFIKERSGDGIVVHDPSALVSFRLPRGWELSRGERWGDHETTLWFKDGDSQVLYTFYYQYPLNPPVTVDPDTSLRLSIENKIKQRRESEKISDYSVRSGSVRKRDIGGLPAMSYIGDFTISNRPQHEYMIRVLGKTTKGHFFFALPDTADLEGAVRKLEDIAVTLRMQ
jgi:hypothetical protein